MPTTGPLAVARSVDVAVRVDVARSVAVATIEDFQAPIGGRAGGHTRGVAT